AVTVMLSVFVTTHFTRREIPYLLQPVGAPEAFSLKRVFGELQLALRNRNFLVLAITLLLSSMILGTSEALSIYLQTYFWGLSGEQLRWFVLTIIGFVVAFSVLPALQARFGKKRIMTVGMLLVTASGIPLIGLRLVHVLPENGSPVLLPLLIA